MTLLLDLIFIIGLAAIALGAFLIAAPAGFITGGLLASASVLMVLSGRAGDA